MSFLNGCLCGDSCFSSLLMPAPELPKRLMSPSLIPNAIVAWNPKQITRPDIVMAIVNEIKRSSHSSLRFMEPHGYAIPVIRFHKEKSICKVLRELRVKHPELAAYSLKALVHTLHTIDPSVKHKTDVVLQFHGHRGTGKKWLKHMAPSFGMKLKSKKVNGSRIVTFQTFVEAFIFAFKMDHSTQQIKNKKFTLRVTLNLSEAMQDTLKALSLAIKEDYSKRLDLLTCGMQTVVVEEKESTSPKRKNEEEYFVRKNPTINHSGSTSSLDMCDEIEFWKILQSLEDAKKCWSL